METISVQNTAIPRLGLGTWQLSGKAASQAVHTAVDLGYRHIDTAQIYENEAEVGDGIKASGLKRQDLFLTTKVWMDKLGPDKMQKSVDESLKRLKTDHVDLLLIHWPVTDVPFKQQLASLRDIQKSGQAKLIGVSNFTVAQLKEVVETIGARIVTNQVEYHPYLNQKPVHDYLLAHDMFLTAYSPLARGAVSQDPVIKAIADKHGKTPGQVTLRWLMQQECVVAIPKAGSEKHIRENFDIFTFQLTDAEMTQINNLAKPDGRIVHPAWSPQWDRAAA